MGNGTRVLIDVDNFFPMVRITKSLKENGKYRHPEGAEGEKLTDYFYKRCGETEKPLTRAGLDELTFRTYASEVPCSRLELELANGTQQLLDVDYFWPLLKQLKSYLETKLLIRQYGTEASVPSPYYYKRCGGSERRLPELAVVELLFFLLKIQEAGRSLHHFTVLNCPLFKHDQKRYVLEVSGIHVCYFIFDEPNCC
uniref:Uncharacterized protein n=1 Tax=Glyptapanteles flavicoxis TaxID=463051 RepID=B7S8F0_9HYME|nr:hypothetical protein GFP_L3_0360 [Glyptapanteles flavicoxis]